MVESGQLGSQKRMQTHMMGSPRQTGKRGRGWDHFDEHTLETHPGDSVDESTASIIVSRKDEGLL